MSWTIERAAPSDAPALSRLAQRSKASWGYDAVDLARWSGDLIFTPEDLELYPTWRANPFAAMYQLHQYVTDPGLIHLEHFWVDPDCMGQGLGRTMFLHAVANAREIDGRRLRILSDPFAEPFYARMGARRCGQMPAPIEKDEERFLPLMEFPLLEADS